MSQSFSQANKQPTSPLPPLKDNDTARTNRSEKRIDKTLEDTFPASDAPASGGITRIERKSRTTTDNTRR